MAGVYGSHVGPLGDCEANAALIAAAPETARKLAEAEARIAELEAALRGLRGSQKGLNYAEWRAAV